MSKILRVEASEILDSRGNPTIEAICTLLSGEVGIASVPSGKSTGVNEALELRDKDNSRYGGLGVLTAIENINVEINNEISGKEFTQASLDETLINLDDTRNKSRLGANAILAVSIAFAKAKAEEENKNLYEYLGGLIGNTEFKSPTPMFNIVNGGKHSDSGLNIQEFMVIPKEEKTFQEKLDIVSNIINSLRDILISKGYTTNLGDEGGFASKLSSNEEAFMLIEEAIEKSSYSKEEVSLGIDVAASNLYKEGKYEITTNGEKKLIGRDEIISWYEGLIAKYPLTSIEDGLEEEDYEGFSLMLNKFKSTTQIVGDDLTVTNVERMQGAKENNSINAVIIKPNQIGTLTETLDAIKFAKDNNWKTIISHRSGETMDTFIADLAVGVSSEFIKSGSPTRPERTCKYERIVEIENLIKN
ncbi:MAG: phosphopyruvate hydratase [Candidatus Pacebacteria bacterium]|nr:phosphopyruvate hydratase [Candidatus Paceibacterota bacterium]